MDTMLPSEERAHLRQFMVKHFNLAELKELAFDLGIDHEALPHSTKGEFALALISYFERQNNLTCLLQQIVARRESDELVALLARSSPCKPRRKMLIINRTTFSELSSDLKAKLTDLLQTHGEEIELINAIQGSTHLLISLPEEETISANQHASSPWQAITRFDALDDLSKIVWRTLSVYLPLTKSDLLRSGLRWAEVANVVDSARRMLQTKQDATAPEAYHYYAGLILVQMRRWGEAVGSFTECLSLAPSFGSAYLNRGFAYEALSRYAAAATDYNLALKFDPSLTDAYIARGSTHVRLGRLDKALHDFDTAIRLSPNMPISYLNRGSVFYRLRRYDDAMLDFNHAISLDPQDKRLYFGRGLTLTKLRQYNHAIIDFNSVLGLDPKDARALMARGVLYERMDLYSAALADFKRALELGDTRAAPYIVELELTEQTPGHFSKAVQQMRASKGEYQESSVEDTLAAAEPVGFEPD
jgi:tetratricopeptide (TPR) repeat protein